MGFGDKGEIRVARVGGANLKPQPDEGRVRGEGGGELELRCLAARDVLVRQLELLQRGEAVSNVGGRG